MFQSVLIQRSRLWLLLVAVASHSAELGAQDAPPRLRPFPSEVICDRGNAPVIDTASITVALGSAGRRTDSLLTPSARDRALFMAQELRSFFRAPVPLTYPKPLVWGPLPKADGTKQPQSFAPFEGHITVIFNEAERVTAVRPSESLANDGLRAALHDAVLRADSAGVFKGLRAGSIVRPDTVILELIALEKPAAPAIPLFQSKVEFLPFSKPVQLKKAGTMAYPFAADVGGIEATIEMQFIVGANGEPHSLYPMTKTYREFLEAAAAAIQSSKFKPAEAGGCRVSQLVQQRLSFKQRPDVIRR